VPNGRYCIGSPLGSIITAAVYAANALRASRKLRLQFVPEWDPLKLATGPIDAYPSRFAQAFVAFGAGTWPSEKDLAPDAMYAEIKRRRRWRHGFRCPPQPHESIPKSALPWM